MSHPQRARAPLAHLSLAHTEADIERRVDIVRHAAEQVFGRTATRA